MVGCVWVSQIHCTRRTDHDLDNLDSCRHFMLCRISCVVHIQPRKPVLDHADYSAPARQHEPNHTDQGNPSALNDLHYDVGIEFLSDVLNIGCRCWCIEIPVLFCSPFWDLNGEKKRKKVQTKVSVTDGYSLDHTKQPGGCRGRGYIRKLRCTAVFDTCPAWLPVVLPARSRLLTLLDPQV